MKNIKKYITYYFVYTTRLFRILEWLMMLSVAIFSVAVSSGIKDILVLLVFTATFFCMGECSIDYFAFAGCCRRDSRQIALYRTAPHGRQFVRGLHGFDIVYRMLKSAILFAVVCVFYGKADVRLALVVFLSANIATVAALNLTRRMGTFQFIPFISMLMAGIAGGLICVAVILVDYSILVIIIYLAVLMAAAYFTYKDMVYEKECA